MHPLWPRMEAPQHRGAASALSEVQVALLGPATAARSLVSIGQIKVVLLNSHFTASENGVLVGLAFTAKNDRPTGWPGIATITGYSGLSHNTIRATLKSLTKCGCLTREIRTGTSDLFTLNMTEIEAHAPLPKLVPRKFGTPTKTMTTSPTKSGTPPLPDLRSQQGKRNVIETEVETETFSVGAKESSNGLYPEWFTQLKVLDGYTNRNHAKSVELIRLACEAGNVDPHEVIRAFIEYWPQGKVAHGWSDPVKSLKNTRNLQVSKVKRSASGSPGRLGGSPERLAMMKAEAEKHR